MDNRKLRLTPKGVMTVHGLSVDESHELLDGLELTARRYYPGAANVAILLNGQGGEFVAIGKGEEKKHAKKS